MKENKIEAEKKKRYLKRYRKNKALIERLEEKLALLDDKISNVSSPVISDEPKVHSGKTNEQRILDKIELEKRIETLRIKGAEIKREICSVIDELDNLKEIEVLEMFFIDCKSFEEITKETGYSLRHVTRLYSRGIDKINVSKMSVKCH